MDHLGDNKSYYLRLQNVLQERVLYWFASFNYKRILFSTISKLSIAQQNKSVSLSLLPIEVNKLWRS